MKRSALSVRDLDLRAVRLEAAVRNLSERYGYLHELGYSTSAQGDDVGRGSNAKHERSVPINSGVSERLADACSALEHAIRSVERAHAELSSAESVLDHHHRDTFDATRAMQAGMSLDRVGMVAVLLSKASHLRSTADEEAKVYESRASKLQRQLDREQQQIARERAKEHTARVSKGKVKRSRATNNGWVPGGKCEACGNVVSGTRGDELRRGLDASCYTSWTSWKLRNDLAGFQSDPARQFAAFIEWRKARLSQTAAEGADDWRAGESGR